MGFGWVSQSIASIALNHYGKMYMGGWHEEETRQGEEVLGGC
jgi:hypothetical protein